MAASASGHHKSRQRNFKKRRRSYRWTGEFPGRRGLRRESTTTKYRARHGIPANISRKEAHAQGICPKHRTK